MLLKREQGYKTLDVRRVYCAFQSAQGPANTPHIPGHIAFPRQATLEKVLKFWELQTIIPQLRGPFCSLAACLALGRWPWVVHIILLDSNLGQLLPPSSSVTLAVWLRSGSCHGSCGLGGRAYCRRSNYDAWGWARFSKAEILERGHRRAICSAFHPTWKGLPEILDGRLLRCLLRPPSFAPPCHPSQGKGGQRLGQQLAKLLPSPPPSLHCLCCDAPH